MIPIILSGGSGSRLWPLSRSTHPKQFINVIGDSTLFQLTLDRLKLLEELENPIIVSNSDHRFLIAEQCRLMAIVPNTILLEPFARNTAPAIAVAAFHAMDNGKDPILLVLPSDHIFSNKVKFQEVITQSKDYALNSSIVTFGIFPTFPETGYGYIKVKSNLIDNEILNVLEFVEKPDIETAKKYVKLKNYFWNSGMFMFKASVYLNLLKIHAPDIFHYSKLAYYKSKKDFNFIHLDDESMNKCPSDSIDYAVIEKSNNVLMKPMQAGWSDVGSWAAVWDIQKKDQNNNYLFGDVVIEGSKNCYVYSDKKLVTLLGVEDLVVVDTPDALLISEKKQSQNVKKIVEKLKKNNRPEINFHKEVSRPWGTFTTIIEEEKYLVKKITLLPKSKISVQYHNHRSEHWVIVKGLAKVTIGEITKILKENESTFIPIGEVHCLENESEKLLEIIEIQTGNHLSEDDIVRLQDIYGRSVKRK